MERQARFGWIPSASDIVTIEMQPCKTEGLHQNAAADITVFLGSFEF